MMSYLIQIGLQVTRFVKRAVLTLIRELSKVMMLWHLFCHVAIDSELAAGACLLVLQALHSWEGKTFASLVDEWTFELFVAVHAAHGLWELLLDQVILLRICQLDVWYSHVLLTPRNDRLFVSNHVEVRSVPRTLIRVHVKHSLEAGRRWIRQFFGFVVKSALEKLNRANLIKRVINRKGKRQRFVSHLVLVALPHFHVFIPLLAIRLHLWVLVTPHLHHRVIVPVHPLCQIRHRKILRIRLMITYLFLKGNDSISSRSIYLVLVGKLHFRGEVRTKNRATAHIIIARFNNHTGANTGTIVNFVGKFIRLIDIGERVFVEEAIVQATTPDNLDRTVAFKYTRTSILCICDHLRDPFILGPRLRKDFHVLPPLRRIRSIRVIIRRK